MTGPKMSPYVTGIDNLNDLIRWLYLCPMNNKYMNENKMNKNNIL